MDDKDKLGKALLKVALGFQVAEVTEEFAEVDGELKLTKRKRTKKDVPPDLKAVQLLLAENGSGAYAEMSDEELEEEKRKLIAALRAETGITGETATQTVYTEIVKKPRKPRAKPRKRVVRKNKE